MFDRVLKFRLNTSWYIIAYATQLTTLTIREKNVSSNDMCDKFTHKTSYLAPLTESLN